MKTTRHRRTNCPGCGSKLDASTCMHVSDRDQTVDQSEPAPGDYSICMRCAQPLKYSKGLRLKAVGTRHLAKLYQRNRPLALIVENLRVAIEHQNKEW